MDKGNANEERPLVFVSYAREDNNSSNNRKGWLNWLLTHMERPLQSAQIELFIDNSIITGEYSPAIRAALNRATAAILLLSPDFMNSKYILEKELPILIARYKIEQLAFFPVLLSHCCWDMLPITYPDSGSNNKYTEFDSSHLLLPGHDPDHPLDSLSDSDVNKVFKEVTKRLLTYHEERREKMRVGQQSGDKKQETEKQVEVKKQENKPINHEKQSGVKPVHKEKRIIQSTTIVSDEQKNESAVIGPEKEVAGSTTIVPGKQTSVTTTIVAQTPSWATHSGIDQYGRFADFTIKGITQRMRWIAPGEFLMGSPPSELERGEDEHQHRVVLSQGFWLADTACTQNLWQAVMKKNSSHFKGQNLPVENVSWEMAQKFIAQSNLLCQGLSLRLPTEAEWEYACRAGTTTPFSFGDTIMTDHVNYDRNHPYGNAKKGNYHGGTTVNVKSLPCNAWGLYQMHGNVWEWCADLYGLDYYKHSPVNDPSGPEKGDYRVVRGGSWFNDAWYARSAYRNRSTPSNRYGSIGFRLARGHQETSRQG